MQADFKHLKPHIDEICSNLGIFAMLWAFVSTIFTRLFFLANKNEWDDQAMYWDQYYT